MKLMSEVALPAGYAPYYNLIWRASTLYLPALARLVCLALAVLQDTRRAIRSPWKRPECSNSLSAGGHAGAGGPGDSRTAVLRGDDLWDR